jgi:hypothetical protein
MAVPCDRLKKVEFTEEDTKAPRSLREKAKYNNPAITEFCG